MYRLNFSGRPSCSLDSGASDFAEGRLVAAAAFAIVEYFLYCPLIEISDLIFLRSMACFMQLQIEHWLIWSSGHLYSEFTLVEEVRLPSRFLRLRPGWSTTYRSQMAFMTSKS
jgi:hypothetical protein